MNEPIRPDQISGAAEAVNPADSIGNNRRWAPAADKGLAACGGRGGQRART